jgi:O-antigen/teichoic acid export membrane protein
MASFLIDRRLRADFGRVLSGNVIYSACQWAIVIVLAKLGTPQEVGLYALGMAVSAPIVLFANLQIRTLLASDVKDEFRFGQYLAFRLVSLGLALVVILVVAGGSAPDWRHRSVIALAGFAQVVEYVSDTYYGLMQKYDRMDRMCRSLMIKGPLGLVALWAAMFVGHDVAWAVFALALGRLFVLLTWDSRLGYARNVDPVFAARPEWDNRNILRLLRTALPLGVISMLASLSGNIPRYFIEGRLGTADLGIYAAIASLLAAGNLVISAFGQSLMVPAARACADGDRSRYRIFVVHSAALGAVLGLGAIFSAALFGRYLLAHLFRAEYADHVDIFIWLMAAGAILFLGGVLGYVMTAARALKPQIPLLLANCTVCAAACAWLVPNHGLRGAVEATIISGLVQLGGSALILLRIDRQLSATFAPLPEPESVGSRVRT